MKKPTMRGLQLQNRKLAKQVLGMKSQLDLGVYQAKNSLASLVSGAQAQTNITSFNPLIQNTIFSPLTLNYSLLTYLYKTHGILQAAIDMPVQDALRGGLDLSCGELSPDDLKALGKFMSEKGIYKAIGQSEGWNRLYGGAGLILNDGTDPSKPLDLKRMKKLSFYPANRWEFQYPGVNPKAQWELMGFGVPINADRFMFYGQNLDASRVMTMSGKAAPYMVAWQLQGWGMSEIERMVEDFNLYLRTNNVLYELLEEAKTDVYAMKGFNQLLMTAAGTEKTRARIQLVNEMKNFNRALVLDAEDKYDQKQITFAGLAEVKKENRMAIASSVRIPMTKLFGISASGFNSGEDDIENYNAMVESEVREPMRPTIQKVLRIVAMHMFGAEFDIDFDYRPLRVLGAVEEEQVKTSKQNRVLGLWDRGLITTREAGEMLEKDQLVSIDIGAANGLMDDVQPPALAMQEEGAEAGDDKKPGDKKEKGGSEK